MSGGAGAPRSGDATRAGGKRPTLRCAHSDTVEEAAA
jgi:hypothetical protein